MLVLVVKILFALLRPSSEWLLWLSSQRFETWQKMNLPHHYQHGVFHLIVVVICILLALRGLPIPYKWCQRLWLPDSTGWDIQKFDIGVLAHTLGKEVGSSRLTPPWATDVVCGSFSAPVDFSESSWKELYEAWKMIYCLLGQYSIVRQS